MLSMQARLAYSPARFPQYTGTGHWAWTLFEEVALPRQDVLQRLEAAQRQARQAGTEEREVEVEVRMQAHAGVLYCVHAWHSTRHQDALVYAAAGPRLPPAPYCHACMHQHAVTECRAR